MTRVSIDGGELRVDIEGLHRLWALRSRLTVPLASVRRVQAGRAPARRALRLAGTALPGVIAAGLFRSREGWEFWDVADRDSVVTVDLEGARYARLVLQVDDPAGTAAMIEQAIA